MRSEKSTLTQLLPHSAFTLLNSVLWGCAQSTLWNVQGPAHMKANTRVLAQVTKLRLLSSPALRSLPSQLMVGYLLCCASSSHTYPWLSCAAVEHHEVTSRLQHCLIGISSKMGMWKTEGFHFKSLYCDHGPGCRLLITQVVGNWRHWWRQMYVLKWNPPLAGMWLTPEHALSHDTLYRQEEKISISSQDPHWWSAACSESYC